MAYRRGIIAVVAIAGGCWAAGCFAPDKPDINSPNANLKIPAIEQAVQAGDQKVVPTLVASLDSDDAAVRFYAIDGLRKLTGQSFGYRYYDDESQRKPAIKSWQHWLTEQQKAGHFK